MGPYRDRDRVEPDNQHQQHERRAVLVRRRARHVRCKDEQVVRQRHHRVEDRVRQEAGREDHRGEHDRCSLSRGPADGQDRAGHDARHGRREDDPADGLPFRGPERKAPFAERMRDAFQ